MPNVTRVLSECNFEEVIIATYILVDNACKEIGPNWKASSSRS